jgi:hypothetical protein
MFLRKSAPQLILYLNKPNCKNTINCISKESKVTYNHTYKLIMLFEKYGLIERKLIKKSPKSNKFLKWKKVYITKKGKNLPIKINELNKLMDVKECYL